MFLLYRNDEKELLLPYIHSQNDIKKEAHNLNSTIFKEYNKLSEYKGYLEYNNEIYLVYYKDNIMTEDAIFQSKENRWWWTLASEIVDDKKLLDIKINEMTISFFLDNKLLLFIFDKNNKTYEIPRCGYYGNNDDIINFISVFGAKKNPPGSSLGPFYYFTTFDKAIIFSIYGFPKKEKKNKKGGLVRFAIFMGKMKLIQHTDMETKSKDVDGFWAKEFDSIFSGIYIKHGQPVMPTFVIKDINQQVPLSQYYVNTDKVKKIGSNNILGYKIE